MTTKPFTSSARILHITTSEDKHLVLLETLPHIGAPEEDIRWLSLTPHPVEAEQAERILAEHYFCQAEEIQAEGVPEDYPLL